MNKEEFRKLYGEEVLTRNKNPYHFEKVEDPSKTIMAYNPLCGDKFTLFLNEQKHHIKSAYFHGFGCALSKASTSLLMEMIEGKDEREVAKMCKTFLEAVDSGNAEHLENNVQKIFAEMKNFEGRTDCIKLSWQTLLNQITGKNEG